MYARLAPYDPEFREGSPGGAAYARTKRMQVALAELLQDRGPRRHRRPHHAPGLGRHPRCRRRRCRVFHKVMGPLLRDPATGADTIVWLAATDPAPGGGQFWMDRAPHPEHSLTTTRESAADLDRLWT